VDGDDALPRRALLGVGLQQEEDGALVVGRVIAASVGEAAGLQPGDVLEALDGERIRSVDEARGLVRRAGEAMRVTFSRHGTRREREVEAAPFPVESVPGSRVRLGHVTRDGARLRTLQTIPEARGPHPGVLLLPGVRCESIDLPLTPYAPVARLVRGLAGAGLSTMRLERSGLGDSEGPPCAEVGFEDELEAYRAALDALRASPEVDPDRVFLYGHSVGGMHAALLAARAPLRGVVVYGSTARRWSACLRDGLRRQLALRGVSEDEIADALRDFDARFPDGRYERSARFHRELDARDLEAAWRRARTELLVLIGAHDWVVSAEEQRDLASLVPGAEVVELDGVDHAFGRHASLEASLRDYGRGAFDERLVEIPARWIAAR
jgi:hypothetical protein